MESLAALADPTRRRIIELLAAGERSAGEIVAQFDMSAPAISQHLRILRAARLVMVRVEGQHRIQALDWRGLQEIEDWLGRTRRFWQRRVDALERQLRAQVEKERRKRTLRPSRHQAGKHERPSRRQPAAGVLSEEHNDKKELR